MLEETTFFLDGAQTPQAPHYESDTLIAPWLSTEENFMKLGC